MEEAVPGGRPGPPPARRQQTLFAEELVGAFRSGIVNEQRRAAQALPCLDLAESPYNLVAAVSALQALPGTEPSLRVDVVQAIGALGSHAAPLTGQLAEVLKDESPEVREAVAVSLGSIVRHAAPHLKTSTVSLLVAAMRDQSDGVRVATIGALMSVGSIELLPHLDALSACLSDSCAQVRVSTVLCFEQLATSDPNVVPQVLLHLDALCACLSDSCAEVRVSAVLCIEHLAASNPVEVSAHASGLLADRLHDTNLKARDGAERVLVNLGTMATRFIYMHMLGIRCHQPEGDGASRRVANMRGCSCTEDGLPIEVVAAFLSEWIYEPEVSPVLPARGLTLIHLQKVDMKVGQNLQWAVVRGEEGEMFITFRGSDSLFDWMENAHITLSTVRLGPGQVLLVHSGFWAAVQNEQDRLQSVAQQEAALRPVSTLVLCGHSKGGATAQLVALSLLLPEKLRLEVKFSSLMVSTFGAPNVVSRGSADDQNTAAINHIRQELLRQGVSSKAYFFPQDPVPLILSSQSSVVLKAGLSGAWSKALSWLQPSAHSTIEKYVGQVQDVSETFEPLLDPESLEVKGRHQSGLDPEAHSRDHYSNVMCQRLLSRAELDAVSRSVSRNSLKKNRQGNVVTADLLAREHSPARSDASAAGALVRASSPPRVVPNFCGMECRANLARSDSPARSDDSVKLESVEYESVEDFCSSVIRRTESVFR